MNLTNRIVRKKKQVILEKITGMNVKYSCIHTDQINGYLYFAVIVSGGFPGGLVINNPPTKTGNVRDLGLIPR